MSKKYIINKGKRQANPANHLNLQCEACGKNFTRFKSYVKKCGAKAKMTCSRKCKHELLKGIREDDPRIDMLVEMYKSGLGCPRISEKTGIGISTVNSTLKRVLGELRDRAFYSGSKSGTFKGGSIGKCGYRYVSTGKKTKIAEQRKVMQDHLGRSLKSYEQVHHMNGDKLDNRVENLMILTASDHTSHHQSIRKQEIDKLKKRILKLEGKLK